METTGGRSPSALPFGATTAMAKRVKGGAGFESSLASTARVFTLRGGRDLTNWTFGFSQAWPPA